MRAIHELKIIWNYHFLPVRKISRRNVTQKIPPLISISKKIKKKRNNKTNPSLIQISQKNIFYKIKAFYFLCPYPVISLYCSVKLLTDFSHKRTVHHTTSRSKPGPLFPTFCAYCFPAQRSDPLSLMQHATWPCIVTLAVVESPSLIVNISFLMLS